ncbi:MAG: ZIP family metal transporter [Flavobacteriales bacterium]|nr:ZIP family metal transporter [Flavobacteriales bacterium]|tara:strand:+ start:843 stop:1724 length:882 start_codon:yes stop_codon:yes gene_type:complete
MEEIIKNIENILPQEAWQRALIAGIFTWALTALGSSLVFLFKKASRKILDICLGFTGGVMIAASFWSLLAPAIHFGEIQLASGNSNTPAFIPPAIGFFLGALFLYWLDKKIPHMHFFQNKIEGASNKSVNWNKTILLVLAIAIHNVPEGLAVGVMFGALDPNLGLTSLSLGGEEIFTIGAAIALGIGIGIQNFPEGFAVSMPLRRQGVSRFKAWQWGQLSAIVEPIFAVFGALLVSQFLPILPYALSFAAGAMIFIVVEEVIPESQSSGNSDLATMGVIAGFIVMMILDVALG